MVLDAGGFREARFAPTFAAMISALPDVSVWAIDIPIGFGPRDADAAARAFIGGKLASSVFPVPSREVFDAASYADALALGTVAGKGVTKQTWALRTKILEVAAAVHEHDNVYETHPEVCFRAMAGAPVRSRKWTWAGLQERKRLLENEGVIVPADIGAAGASAAPDDVLDAAAAAWTARRIAGGAARCLPEGPGGDTPLIWY